MTETNIFKPIKATKISKTKWKLKFLGDSVCCCTDIPYKNKESENKIYRIEIHSGFVTGFTSVPPFVRKWLNPYTDIGKILIIHDYMFKLKIFSRNTQHQIVDELLNKRKINIFKIFLVKFLIKINKKTSW